MRSSTGQRELLVRVGSRLCALPLQHVIEILRPLPTTPLAGSPAYVLGVAVERGEPVPVIDLDAFLGATAAFAGRRFVMVRTGGRRVALAVEDVLGLRDTGAAEPHVVPLLSHACQGAVASLSALDDELLVVLRLARLVPDGVWEALAAGAPRDASGRKA